MGCNCGGKKPAGPRAAGAARSHGDVDPTPHVWRVQFPNGATQDFSYEWQANAARAAGGGHPPKKIYTERSKTTHG